MFLVGGKDPIWRGSPFSASWGDGGNGPGPSRVLVAPSEAIGFSAHSFLAFAATVTGDGGTPELSTIWGGQINVNYLGFSTLKARWDANGVDRTGAYSGALWATEFTNPADGWPAVNSDASRETLQYLYWYALTAQAKGCKAMFIYPPWSPEGMDIDAATMARAQSWRDWLVARAEITIPVYVMPVPIIVARFRARFAPQSIYSDGLHLRGPTDAAPNANMDALATGLYAMMTGQRVATNPAWSADMLAQVGIVWAAIQEYATTGLGGTVTVTGDFGGADPLPNPAALP